MHIPLLADNARKRHTFRFEDIIFCDLFFHRLSNIRSMNIVFLVISEIFITIVFFALPIPF